MGTLLLHHHPHPLDPIIEGAGVEIAATIDQTVTVARRAAMINAQVSVSEVARLRTHPPAKPPLAAAAVIVIVIMNAASIDAAAAAAPALISIGVGAEARAGVSVGAGSASERIGIVSVSVSAGGNQRVARGRNESEVAAHLQNQAAPTRAVAVTAAHLHRLTVIHQAVSIVIVAAVAAERKSENIPRSTNVIAVVVNPRRRRKIRRSISDRVDHAHGPDLDHEAIALLTSHLDNAPHSIPPPHLILTMMHHDHPLVDTRFDTTFQKRKPIVIVMPTCKACAHSSIKPYKDNVDCMSWMASV